MAAAVLACVDVGSTFTKATAIDADSGEPLASAQCPTTTAVDVLHGLDRAVDRLGCGSLPDSQLLVCSSAGGGLRLAVVGQERAISAEAGWRVALSAGARVVAVTSGRLAGGSLDELAGSRPDVVLLVGGTDGGEPAILLHNAAALAAWPVGVPVVVAGNAEAGPEALGMLAGSRAARLCANVIPRIGTLQPGPARAAIRELFVSHVIGGKGLSAGSRFAGLVRCPTPDAVLAGLECLAQARNGAQSGDVLLVDVGGATTDVYSVLSGGGNGGLDVVETAWQGRTVEGDLGMRWSAQSLVEAARAQRLEVPDDLATAAAGRVADVAMVPADPREMGDDLLLARMAATLAVRRHARPGPHGHRDLTDVSLLIGSGGVLRHADPADALAVLAGVVGDVTGGWRLPRAARLAVDRHYLMAPIGLLTLSGRTDLARIVADRALVGMRSGAG